MPCRAYCILLKNTSVNQMGENTNSVQGSTIHMLTVFRRSMLYGITRINQITNFKLINKSVDCGHVRWTWGKWK